jgi:hypothetical protein
MVAELTPAGGRENGAGQRLVLVEVGEDLGDGLRDRLGRHAVGEVPDALVVPLRQSVEQRVARREVAVDGAFRHPGAAGDTGHREVLDPAAGELGAERLEDDRSGLSRPAIP